MYHYRLRNMVPTSVHYSCSKYISCGGLLVENYIPVQLYNANAVLFETYVTNRANNISVYLFTSEIVQFNSTIHV